MDFVIGMIITAFCGFLVVKFVLYPLLAPLDKISNEDFKEAFGYDKNFHIWEITNAFIAFFLALYFYVKGRYFRYLMLVLICCENKILFCGCKNTADSGRPQH